MRLSEEIVRAAGQAKAKDSADVGREAYNRLMTRLAREWQETVQHSDEGHFSAFLDEIAEAVQQDRSSAVLLIVHLSGSLRLALDRLEAESVQELERPDNP